MRKKFFILLMSTGLLLVAVTAFATPTILGEFQIKYPSSTSNSFSCALCHNGSPDISTLYNYGSALHNNGINTPYPTQDQFDAAATAVEPLDSDGDGFSNIDEINAGTNPSDPASHPAPASTPAQTSMPCPAGNGVFGLYAPPASPSVSADPATAQPVGIMVEPNDDVDILLNASFDCPVDVTLSLYAPDADPQDVFFIDPTGVTRLSESAAMAGSNGIGDGSANQLWKKLENLVFYSTDITQLNVGPEELHAVFPPGVYVVTLGVTPSGTQGQTSYRWSTFFLIQ